MNFGKSPPGPKLRLAWIPPVYISSMSVISEDVPKQNPGRFGPSQNHTENIRPVIIYNHQQLLYSLVFFQHNSGARVLQTWKGYRCRIVFICRRVTRNVTGCKSSTIYPYVVVSSLPATYLKLLR